jgi:hypothetical protein
MHRSAREKTSNEEISPPAMKARPSPEMITTRIAASAATSRTASCSARAQAGLSAFKTSGRLNRISATAPSLRSSTGACEFDIVPSSPAFPAPDRALSAAERSC